MEKAKSRATMEASEKAQMMINLITTILPLVLKPDDAQDILTWFFAFVCVLHMVIWCMSS
ncbi:hypothetical protein YC2023_044780 [Brassica napus]